MRFSFPLLTGLLLLLPTMLLAQRPPTPYESLLQRTDRPATYVSHVTFPTGESEGVMASMFRFEYNFIPFLKIRSDMQPPQESAEYYAPLQLTFEVFEGRSSKGGRSAEGAVSVFRDTWQDTVWAENYDETQSRFEYVQGVMDTELEGGSYHYLLQLAQAGSPTTRPSRSRDVEIVGSEGGEKAEFFLLESGDLNENSFSGTFMNYASNVLYGQDYALLVRIPQSLQNSAETFRLELKQLPAGANEESKNGEVRFSEEIYDSGLFHLNNFQFDSDGESVTLHADLTSEGALYALVSVPNKNFENALYRAELGESDGDEVFGSQMIRSQWLDMPVSLYNLDVAVDMLRFIVSDSELERIDSGSDAEKERKFRQFWAQRDPTPDTEFNELMSEYYERIDYAYREFSSMQEPGYESDRGQAYILYGPPTDVERRFPTNAPTREVWEYPNRTLIFEATSGFGDFRLVSESTS
jgi:GWxTD domain-containing protein